ncbi:MAG: FAD-dependent oxidoreductase, partial [Gemmatimonadales bacterium]
MKLAVVGGGVAGLTAAYDLIKRGHEVSLFEGAERLGGLIHTEECGGILVEHGAEGFVEEGSPIPKLCDELGIGCEIVPQQTHRSLVWNGDRLDQLPRGMAAQILGIQLRDPNREPNLATFRGGMGTQIWALTEQVSNSCEISLSTPALTTVGTGGGVELTTDSETLVFDGVVVALPPTRASQLFQGWARDEASVLRSVPTKSSVVVAMVFPRQAVGHALAESGLVVPEDARPASGFLACSFVSSKFPGRVPQEFALLRAFFRPTSTAARSDAEWIDASLETLSKPLKLEGQPQHAWVDRHEDA